MKPIFNESVPAVEVQQNATPARHDVAIVPNPPAMGRDSRRPIVVTVKQ